MIEKLIIMVIGYIFIRCFEFIIKCAIDNNSTTLYPIDVHYEEEEEEEEYPCMGCGYHHMGCTCFDEEE